MKRDRIGKYELLGSLGRGSFANVYKAKNNDGAIVALKILNGYLLDHPDIIQRFIHEADMLSKLYHPGICRLRDFFYDGTDYAIVLDYIDGEDLKEFMHRYPDNLVPFEHAVKIAGECLSALQYAHEKRVLHRDIKPSNIMIDTNGKSIITDFGTAVSLEEKINSDDNRIMSVSYSAPERIIRENKADVRSDIYSLGMVFYQLFTGGLPFDTNSVPEIKSWHIHNTPLPPDVHIPSLPTKITHAIKKSLEKKPENRFHDFPAFKSAMAV